MIEPDYPKPDPDRPKRIVTDVINLLKLNDNERNRAMAAAWLKHVLVKARQTSKLPWWFQRRLFCCLAYPGQDVFDLQGDKLEAILSVYCPMKLEQKPAGYIIEHRAASAMDNLANCGEPACYAQHGGRLHLWPAPEQPYPLQITYTAPITPECIPSSWETIVIDGIIGLYGRHFDSSGLLEDAAAFVERFYAALKQDRDCNNLDVIKCDQDPALPAMAGDSISSAWLQINASAYEAEIIRPAYTDVAGAMQIRPNRDNTLMAQHGMPFVQIPGDRQP